MSISISIFMSKSVILFKKMVHLISLSFFNTSGGPKSVGETLIFSVKFQCLFVFRTGFNLFVLERRRPLRVIRLSVKTCKQAEHLETSRDNVSCSRGTWTVLRRVESLAHLSEWACEKCDVCNMKTQIICVLCHWNPSSWTACAGLSRHRSFNWPDEKNRTYWTL